MSSLSLSRHKLVLFPESKFYSNEACLPQDSAYTFYPVILKDSFTELFCQNQWDDKNILRASIGWVELMIFPENSMLLSGLAPITYPITPLFFSTQYENG